MSLSDVSSDVLILVFYIVLTIILILFGKLVGKTAYAWYNTIDPGAYNKSAGTETCQLDPQGGIKCTPRPADEVAKAALENAESDGRALGAFIGFMIGGVLSVFKAYNIYVKLRETK